MITIDTLKNIDEPGFANNMYAINVNHTQRASSAFLRYMRHNMGGANNGFNEFYKVRYLHNGFYLQIKFKHGNILQLNSISKSNSQT
jgi:hypothetical protein